MSSPSNLRVAALRKGSFALQDDAYNIGSYKGKGALSSLIRQRSSKALHRLGDEEQGRDRHDSTDEDDGPYSGRVSSESQDGERRPLAAVLQHGPAPQSQAAYLRLQDERPQHRSSARPDAGLTDSQARSMRLIGHNNPRYRWARYWKSDEELAHIKPKRLRQYYERNNYLIQQYLYIDRLLDSSLPHDLLNEYSDMPASGFRSVEVPGTICEEPGGRGERQGEAGRDGGVAGNGPKKVKRTPRDIYRPSETTPLVAKHRAENGVDTDGAIDDEDDELSLEVPALEDDDDVSSSSRIVTLAIYVNLLANAILLAGKTIVIITVPSVSVLASLVDAVLDFLSTGIVWTTTWLISRQDQYKYPVGRRRLEPIGVLVFAVIMITSFVQVALQAVQTLVGPDHTIIELGIPAMGIMLGTIVIKGLVWLWLRSVKNSSVEALAGDAATDVVFNTGSIAFPIVGFYGKIWWLDALGGLLLSLVVIFNWSRSATEHIKHLAGFSAGADQRNICTAVPDYALRQTIKQIQGLQAYHAGDKLNVEVDIVLDANMSLKDSHDLSESLQYVLESVPIVDRAFVHVDYAGYNLPTHMEQQAG